MGLTNFGAVLGFAQDLETGDAAYYRTLAACAPPEAVQVYEGLAKQSEKNAKLLARTRRENVTEMILEPIEGLMGERFIQDTCDPSAAGQEAAHALAKTLETRARDFYDTAAAKLTALPEVARVLKRLGKQRTQRLETLSAS